MRTYSYVSKLRGKSPSDVIHSVQRLRFGGSCQLHSIVPSTQLSCRGAPRLLDYKPDQVVTGYMSLMHNYLNSFTLQRFGITSSASPQPNEKEGPHPENEPLNSPSESNANVKANEGGEICDKVEGSNEKANSDSESEEELTMEDLMKLVVEKEELLKEKHKEMEKMQDKVLRTYAELENVMERTKREAENSKKFAIQNFAKGLLDVADNLGRASSVVKDRFVKIEESEDSSGALPLLKTLLEGVEMTEKQLAEVFKKFGMEKYDPTNEPFDPHKHNAVFRVPDASKPPETVAVVLKPGYTLHERVLRPAEVGVTIAAETTEAERA